MITEMYDDVKAYELGDVPMNHLSDFSPFELASTLNRNVARRFRTKRVVCLVIAVSIGSLPPSCAGAPDTAEQIQDSEEQDFPDTPVGRLMSDHVAVAVGTGRDAEEKYQASLKTLRQQPEAVTAQITETYNKIHESRYFRRWLLVETLRELHSDQSLAALETIAASPIPVEKWSDDEAFSQDKEISIRTTAIAGIADLASRGNQEAAEILTRFFEHDNPSVRRVAISGYAYPGNDYEDRIDYLKRVLPPEDQRFIALSKTDIESVKHPDIPDIRLKQPKSDGERPRVNREEQ